MFFTDEDLRNAKPVVPLEPTAAQEEPPFLQHHRGVERLKNQTPSRVRRPWSGSGFVKGTLILVIGLAALGVTPGRRPVPAPPAAEPPHWNETENLLELGDAPCNGGGTKEVVRADYPKFRFRLLPWCSSPAFTQWKSSIIYDSISYPPNFEANNVSISYETDSSILYDNRRSVIFTNRSDKVEFVTMWPSR